MWENGYFKYPFEFLLWFRVQVEGVMAGFRVARDSLTQFPLF